MITSKKQSLTTIIALGVTCSEGECLNTTCLRCGSALTRTSLTAGCYQSQNTAVQQRHFCDDGVKFVSRSFSEGNES